jgi:hypothetical protein
MNKKLLVGFVAVFVLVFVLDYLVNNILMMSDYMNTMQLWRPVEEMKMGVILVTQLVFAFFFTFIFAKGYEGKGVMEGLRYGFYISLMMNLTGAYMTYATMPVPYMLTLKWFLYGTAEYMIYGAVLAVIYGKMSAKADPAKKTMETVG